MINLTLKQKIIGAVVAIGIALIAIFNFGLWGKNKPTLPAEPVANRNAGVSASQNSENIEIVSTLPAELKEKKDVIVIPTQVIEITFNQQLENVPETRVVIEPELKYKVELWNDRKTVRIIPDKALTLGQGYTLFIKGDTKFEGKKTLGQDIDFHFTTISYRGV